MNLTSTKDRVFVSWHEAELLADGPTLEDAMSDFIESLVKRCTVIFKPGIKLCPEFQKTKDRITRYIQPVTTEGLLA